MADPDLSMMMNLLQTDIRSLRSDVHSIDAKMEALTDRVDQSLMEHGRNYSGISRQFRHFGGDLEAIDERLAAVEAQVGIGGENG